MLPAEGVLGIFTEPAAAARAIRGLHAGGYPDVRAAMPAPFPEVIEAVGLPRSWVGFTTLAATVTGLMAGFTLCIATSLAWPLVVGGKPILSLPTFAVIGFEAAVLVGGSVTHAVLAFVTVSGRWRRRVPPDPRFSSDRIGVYVIGEPGGAEAVLREHGAEEVTRV